MKKWKKLGLIFDPTNRFDWMQTHAQLPIVTPVTTTQGEDVTKKKYQYRIYFASRDNQQRSQIGAIEIDINNPKEILSITKVPLLRYGEMGYFDEHGVFPSSIVDVGGKLYMYYIGWNKGAEYPMFYASVGLAISDDGGKTFTKYSRAPIMSRSECDPWMVTAPFVIKENNLFRMYYVSGLKWERNESGELKSSYHTKYAESEDGINWKREGKIAINFSNEDEINISKSCVIKESDVYKAFFSTSTRDRAYQLAYAESIDGIEFTRKDNELCLKSSNNEFDSDMMSYPYVIKVHDKKYLFYNGNNFGMAGIGLAVEN